MLNFLLYLDPPNVCHLFSYLKTRLSTLLCSNIIYSYTCSSCNAAYYGKTSRNLKNRCSEHLGINKSGRKINYPSNSSIYQHINSSDHSGSLEDFKIISKNNNPMDLLI